jgi:hypothetical protein
MFDALTLRAHQSPATAQPLNLGDLAEALLFYHEVHLNADRSVLEQLLKEVGPELLLELLSELHLRVTYLQDGFGIYTNAAGNIVDPGIYSSPSLAFEEALPQVLEQVTGRRGYSHRMARRLSGLIPTSSHEPTLPNILRADFSDIAYLQQGVVHLLRTYCPEYPLPTPLLFHVVPNGKRFAVASNIDFSAVNQLLQRRIPPSHSTLSAAGLIAHFATARANLDYAAARNAEIAADVPHGGLIQARVQRIIEQRAASDKTIARFQDMVLDDARAIGEAINRGERSFAELLPLLRTAQKFRGWVHMQPPGMDIAKAYFKEVTKESWVDKLPPKAIRWVIFTTAGLGLDAAGLGGVGTMIATALGAADTFLLDRILRGWKPSQFVTGPLMKFVKSE